MTVRQHLAGVVGQGVGWKPHFEVQSAAPGISVAWHLQVFSAKKNEFSRARLCLESENEDLAKQMASEAFENAVLAYGPESVAWTSCNSSSCLQQKS